MARRARVGKKASIGMELVGDKELIKAINALNWQVKNKVTDKAVRDGAKPIRVAMKANAPDSRRTGSREKQSTSTRSKWKNTARLKTVIKSVVRKYEKGAIGIIGPSYSDGGGHGNFFSPVTHKRKVLWGKEPRSAASRVINRFVKDTVDQTQEQSRAAMIQSIKKSMHDAIKKVKLK